MRTTTRRGFGSVITAVAAAGCADNGDAGIEEDPKMQLEQRADEFVEAINTGDSETYESMIANSAEIEDEWEGSDAQGFAEDDAEIGDFEIIEFDETRAEVEFDIEFGDVIADNLGIALVYEFHRIDGTWMVVDVRNA